MLTKCVLIGDGSRGGRSSPAWSPLSTTTFHSGGKSSGLTWAASMTCTSAIAPSAPRSPWRSSRSSCSLKTGVFVSSGWSATRTATLSVYGVVDSGSSACAKDKGQRTKDKASSRAACGLAIRHDMTKSLQVGEEVGIRLGDAAGILDDDARHLEADQRQAHRHAMVIVRFDFGAVQRPWRDPQT